MHLKEYFQMIILVINSFLNDINFRNLLIIYLYLNINAGLIYGFTII